MNLEVKTTQFVLKGQNGKDAVLERPFINDDKELEFKFCSFFEGRVLLNREKGAIELLSKGKKIQILLKGENQELYKEALLLRNNIITNLLELTDSFKNGNEPIYVLETGHKEYPYYITTPTLLENGNLSPKYSKGLIYFLNKELKEAGKKLEVSNEEELQLKMREILKKANLKKFKKGKIEDSSYYELSMKELIGLV